jgi:N-acyl-L-homoserine lactone synthetase
MKIPLLHSIGMSVRPLGLSQEVSGEQNTAVYYDMSEEVLTRVRKSAGIRHSVLERNGAIAPVTELPITALAPSRMQ